MATTAFRSGSIRTTAERLGTPTQTDPAAAAIHEGPLRNSRAPTGMRARTVLVSGSIRHTDPEGRPRCRARKNLDRHPNYILAAYMASGT